MLISCLIITGLLLAVNNAGFSTLSFTWPVRLNDPARALGFQAVVNHAVREPAAQAVRLTE